MEHSLKDLKVASASERGDVRKGMQDVIQQMTLADDEIKGLSASLAMLQSAQSSRLTAIQKSCTHQEAQLKGIKKQQEAHASDMKQLHQSMEPVQGGIKALNTISREVSSAVGAVSKRLPAASAAQPQAALVESLQAGVRGVSEEAGNLATLRQALDKDVQEVQSLLQAAAGAAAALHPQAAAANHRQPAPRDMPMLASDLRTALIPGSAADASSQQVLTDAQAGNQEALGIIDQQPHSSQLHPGMQSGSREQWSQVTAWLAQLQDLPRAATLIIRSLDSVLQHLEELKVYHPSSELEGLQNLTSIMLSPFLHNLNCNHLNRTHWQMS